MRLVLLGLAVAIAVYALHRLALALESRGWIHYARGRGRSGSLGHALLEPSCRHAVEAVETRPEQQESGASSAQASHLELPRAASAPCPIPVDAGG